MATPPIPSRTPKFKVGDIVTLNAGGPDMTVREVRTGLRSGDFLGGYGCQWFAGKKLESGNFVEESLVAVPAKPEKKS